jgi:hypothetical protein
MWFQLLFGTNGLGLVLGPGPRIGETRRDLETLRATGYAEIAYFKGFS